MLLHQYGGAATGGAKKIFLWLQSDADCAIFNLVTILKLESAMNPVKLTVPTEFQIEITAMNLKYGRKEDSSFCPVALAVKDALTNMNVRYDYIDVANTVLIGCGHERWEYNISDELREAIVQFDEADKPIPMRIYHVVFARKLHELLCAAGA